MAMWVLNITTIPVASANQWEGTVLNMSPSQLHWMIMPNRSLVNFETIHMSVSFRKILLAKQLEMTPPTDAKADLPGTCAVQKSWQFECSHFSPRKKAKVPRLFMFFFLKVPNVPNRISKPKFQASLGNGAISFSIPGLEGFTHTIRQQGHGSEKKLPMTTSPRGISPSESGHN